MIKPIKKFAIQITPIKFINSGKLPKNDIVSVNKLQQAFEKVPPEDEFIQVSVSEIVDYTEKSKNKDKNRRED